MNLADKSIESKKNKCADKAVIGKNCAQSSRKKQRVIKAGSGILSGAINGFFGGGGGMVVVPMLKKFCGYEEKQAHATAIAVILPITVFSGVISAFGYGVDWKTLIPVAVGSVVGGVIGGLFLKKLKSKTIGIIFAVAMLAAGVKLTFF